MPLTATYLYRSVGSTSMCILDSLVHTLSCIHLSISVSKTAEEGNRIHDRGLDLTASLLAIQLNSSKARAGNELSLSRWCIASLYCLSFIPVCDRFLEGL